MAKYAASCCDQSTPVLLWTLSTADMPLCGQLAALVICMQGAHNEAAP